ncbi:hypothetical protein BGZ65_009234, partial [Modicella reniformis]
PDAHVNPIKGVLNEPAGFINGSDKVKAWYIHTVSVIRAAIGTEGVPRNDFLGVDWFPAWCLVASRSPSLSPLLKYLALMGIPSTFLKDVRNDQSYFSGATRTSPSSSEVLPVSPENLATYRMSHSRLSSLLDVLEDHSGSL